MFFFLSSLDRKQ